MQKEKQATIRCERTETANYCSCRCGILLPTRTLFCCCRQLAGGYGWRQISLIQNRCCTRTREPFGLSGARFLVNFVLFSESRSSQTSQGRAGRANLARRPSSSASHKRPTRQSIECAPSLILAVALYRTCQTIRCADHKFHSFAPLTFFAVGGREKRSQQVL